MKTKKQYQNDLNDIKNITKTIRRMNESIMFEDEYDNFDNETPEEMEEPLPNEEPVDTPVEKAQPEEIETGVEAQGDIKDADAEDKGMAELDEMGELDQIREITLKGMLKFANQPEHPQFQALQKIFQMCNKAVDNKENTQNI